MLIVYKFVQRNLIFNLMISVTEAILAAFTEGSQVR